MDTNKQLIKEVEAFTNQSDEQFNQLLLYIFTGIFYLFMLDMMYQLGKVLLDRMRILLDI